MANRNRNTKQSLLARKEELLKELKYYEKRIEDARSKTNSSFNYESSDSEPEFTVQLEPSIAELKLKQSTLETCLYATQELTSIQILQSEVNFMTAEPVFEREPPIKEEGEWREVTVECRVDLVPFSMNFYVHRPKRLLAPLQYRNLQVSPVKSSHEQELAASVLPSVMTPSDAVEVLRNYAKAHRSRRSSLARLAEKYGHTLFMEPLPEGGYILKCGNLLELSWVLQNKWSPIAPFHHKLKFDLEYMDESYIKIITQAHRQLSDPAVETDERTLLLSKIISTCLQANKQTDKNQESDLDQNVDRNVGKKQTVDSEIMAPPKIIPKKNKRKISEDNSSGKRFKVDDKENSNGDNDGRSREVTRNSNLNGDSESVKQFNNKKSKVNDNIMRTDNKFVNNEVLNKKMERNMKIDEIKSKMDKKEQLNRKNKEKDTRVSLKDKITEKVKLNNNLKAFSKEKNSQPKENAQIIKENNPNIDKKDKNNKKNKEIVKLNSNNNFKSNNKMSNKNIETQKDNLKEKKNKTDNKEIVNTDIEKNKTNIKKNEEISKKNNKNAIKNDENVSNNKNKQNIIEKTASNNDLQSKNKEINKNKTKMDKNKLKTNKINMNNEKQFKTVKDIKSKVISKEMNRNKIVNKTKISENKFEIDRNSKKQTNLSINSTLSSKDKSKLISKIPQRIQSMDIKKNLLRLSPRFMKKPSVKPRM